MDRLPVSLLCLLCVLLSDVRAQEPAGGGLPDGAIARVGSIQLRHQAPIQQLAFLPNGLLGALDGRGTFRVWNPRTGYERRSFALQAPPGESNQFESMRRMEMMMMMRMGRGKRGFRNRDFEGNTSLTPHLFSPEGRFLAAAEFDKVTVHDTTTGKVSRQITLRAMDRKDLREISRREMLPNPLAFSPDGKYLAVGSGMLGGTLQVFDLTSGKEVHTLRVPNGHWVFRLMFFPGGTHLAGQGDEQVLIWDLKTGKRIRTYQSSRESMNALALSPDGRKLATANEEAGISLWDDSSEEETATIKGGERSILTIVFSPDGKTLLTGCVDHTLRLFDMMTNKESKHLEGHDSPVVAVAFSPDGKLAASGDTNGRIRIWDLAKGKECVPVETAQPVLFVSVQGPTMLVLGGPDGSVRHADLLTGKVVHRFKGPEGAGGGALFSEDGKLVALPGIEKGESAPRLWNVAQGKELPALKGVTEISGLTFSPDGKRIALTHGEENVVQLWDVAKAEMLATLGPRCESVHFSPDGRTLLTAHPGGQISVWELATNKVRLRFQGPGSDPRALAIAPNGRQLATASGEIIRLWSLTTGKVQFALAGHMGAVTALAYSRDGTHLASGSGDGSVRLWDLAKGQPLHHFTGHRDAVRSLAFSGDGKILVSGSADATALVWDLEAPLQEPNKPEALKKLESLWTALASEDSEPAFAAQNALIAQADAAVAHLRKVLSPAAAAAPEEIRKLIAQLDERRFPIREKAMQELTRLGGQAGPALKAALEAKPSSEVAKRLQQLVERLSKPATGGEELREVRAIEALEQIGTAEARKLLEELAKGAGGAKLTEEAKTALDRLTPRPTASPSLKENPPAESR